MTTKAIELAKECGALIGSVVDSCGDSVLLSIEDFETFYARAQAQALRGAADWFDEHDTDAAEHLRRMATELEGKA